MNRHLSGRSDYSSSGRKVNVRGIGIGTAVVIVFLAAWLFFHFRGSDYGRPFCLHPDEPAFAERALTILRTGDFNPRFFWFPSLSIYLQTGVSALAHSYLISTGRYGDHEYRLVEDIGYREKFYFYQAGRVVSALFGAAIVVLIYLLARFFLARWASLLAAAAVMIFPLVVEQVHSLVPNILGTFLATAAVYSSIRFLDRRKKKAIYLAALFAGLAFGTKYNLSLLLIPVLAALLFSKLPGKGGRVVLVLLIFGGIFLLTTPFALFDLPAFVNGYCYELHHYKWAGHATGWPSLLGAEGKGPLRFYFNYFIEQGVVFFVLAVFGLFSLLRISGRKGLVALSFPLCYFIFLTRFRVTFPRNLLFIIPFLGLGFGAFSAFFYDWLKKRALRQPYPLARRIFPPLLVVLVTVAAFYRPVKCSLWWQRKFSLSHPVQAAQKWIEENVPPDSRIVCDQNPLPTLVVPVPDEEFSVRVAPPVFFCRTYIDYLAEDYLVSTVANAYDRYGWLRDRIADSLQKDASPEDRALLEDYLTANRELLRERFKLAARIYEYPANIKGDGVLIYKVPEYQTRLIRPQDFHPDESLRSRLERNELTVREYVPFYWNGTVSCPVRLSPGRYDVFVRAAANRGRNVPVPRLRVGLGAGNPQEIEVIFSEPADYGLTFQVEEGEGKKLTVSFVNDRGEDSDLFLYRVVLVRIPDEPDPKEKTPASGRNRS